MNIENYFLDYLQKHPTLVLPYFGVFTLEIRHSQLQLERNSLLPPSKKLSFVRNTHVSDLDFCKFVSEKSGIALHKIHQELARKIGEWNKELLLNHKIRVSQLGDVWSENNEVYFKPDESKAYSKDFFGLEELSLDELSQPQQQDEKNNPSRLEKITLYLFLLIFPLMGLFTIGYLYKEVLFGKTSDISPPKMVSAIKTMPSDNTKSIKKQPLKTDSSKTNSTTNNTKAPTP